jgi:hypothetical protein
MSFSSPSSLPPPHLTSQDVEHLNALALAHYIVGVVIALSGFLGIFHFGIGVAMLTGLLPAKPEEQAMLTFMGAMFAGMAGLFMVMLWTLGAAVIWGGRNLKRRGSWMLAMVVAAVLLTYTPIGTVLGVLTMVVLLRPNVKAVFQSSAAASGGLM